VYQPKTAFFLCSKVVFAVNKANLKQVITFISVLAICIFNLITTVEVFGRLNSYDIAFTIIVPLLFAFIAVRLSNAWAITLSALFLTGYLIKSFYMWGIVGNTSLLINVSLDWVRLSKSDVETAHTYSMLGIIAALAGSALITNIRVKLVMPRYEWKKVRQRMYLPVIVGAFAVSFALSIVQIVFGINVMGIGSNQLPQYISTPLNRIKLDIIPAILVLGYWISSMEENPKNRRITIILLILLGLLDGISRASRASAVPYLLPVAFLWFITGQFKLRRVLLMTAVVFIVGLTFPIISTYRGLLINKYSTSSAILKIIDDPIGSYDNQQVWDPFVRMATRMTGVDSVALILPYAPQGSVFRVGDFFGNRAIKFFTEEIVGIKSANDFRSPGLIGTYMLAFGTTGYLIAMFLLPFLLWFISRLLSGLAAAPVLLSLFFSELLFGLSENPLEINNWISFSLTVYLLQWLTKFFWSKTLQTDTRSKHSSENSPTVIGNEP
jgi:hypothetical protein